MKTGGLRGGMSAIETYQLTKRFPRMQGWRDLARLLPRWRAADEITALDRVDLTVRPGEVFGLLGPNGAGKTTFIKILCVLILPTAGHACVNGHDLRQEQAIKASIGLVTGDERSFSWRLSGRDNLIFFGRLYGLKRPAAVQRAQELLEQVGLSEVADRSYQTYSAGMKQRLAIARGLLHMPAILFMDEPTRSLDPNHTRQLHTLIRQELVGRRGMTVLISTHRLDEAAALCDRIAILDHGRVRACGTLTELHGLVRQGQRYEVLVRGLGAPAQAALTRALPEVHIQPEADGETRLTFAAFDDSEELQRVLEHTLAVGGRIRAVQHHLVSLEEIFAAVTGGQESDARG